MRESRLRPMQEADLEAVLRWRNADPVRRRMYSTQEISAEVHAAWWARSKTDPQTRLMVFEHAEEACAVVSYTRYTGVDGSATLAFYGDPDRKQRQIAAQLELLAFEHAFETLQVRRLEGEVIDFNTSVARFHLRQGARLEGTRRQAYVRDDVAHDVQHFGMLREDWQSEIGPTLRMRASADALSFEDWTGHAIRAPLVVGESKLPEAAMALEIANRLGNALPLGSAQLVAQSLSFSSAAMPDAHLSMRARVATHIGSRVVWAVRLLRNDGRRAEAVAAREIAQGWFEFRSVVKEGDGR